MQARLSQVSDHGMYELTLTTGDDLAWFLLDADEAVAFAALVDELDPDLTVLNLAELCGLVRSVTGAAPDEQVTWPPPIQP